MITKGALSNILSICTKAEMEDGKIVDIEEASKTIEKLYEEYSGKGYRALGVAYKNIGIQSTIEDELETDMTFLGIYHVV